MFFFLDEESNERVNGVREYEWNRVTIIITSIKRHM